MPGTLYHLYFGKLTHEALHDRGIELDLPKYLSGNLLPDLARDKHSAHFYPNPSVAIDAFYDIDLDAANQYYSHLEDFSLRLGVLAHLWLDEVFTLKLLVKKYQLKSNNGQKYIKRLDYPHQVWPLATFFSFDGLYRAYSECNPLVFERENISLEWIKSYAPYEIPPTGLSILDERIPDNWLDLLERRLEDPPQYLGEFFCYDELIGLIKNSVNQFVKYAYSKILQLDNFQRLQLSPLIFIPGPYRFSVRWEVLREGITEIVLGNPYIDPNLKGTVEDFVIASCLIYQSYHEQLQKDRNIDAPDFINSIARHGYDYYRLDLETAYLSVIRTIHTDPGYPNTLNQVFLNLGATIDKSQRTSREWVVPLTNLLKALVAASGHFYRLVVGYSTL